MIPSESPCIHLTVDIIIELHGKAIARFGGSLGIRELPLLESAIATPQSSFGGQSPYADLQEIAAAYLFYLCRNHPFVDGNKRVALGACLLFLRQNGLSPSPDSVEWENLTMSVAAGALSRDETSAWVRKLVN